jgi:hypothetical protein
LGNLLTGCRNLGKFWKFWKFWEVLAELGFYHFHFFVIAIYLVAECSTVLIGFTP